MTQLMTRNILPMTSEVAGASAYQAGPPLLTDDEFTKLKEQVNGSHMALERHRAARKRTKAQYIGDSFGIEAQGGTYESIVNMLDQMIEVYMQNLVTSNPQVLVVTEKKALKTQASYFQRALNYVLRIINVKQSFAYGVLESLFAPITVFKVGVERPSETDKSYPFDASAIPFVDPIFFNDFVFDTSVERWELCRYYGDRYLMHVDTVKNDPRNNPEVVRDLDGGAESTTFDTSGASDEGKLTGRNPYDSEKKDFVPLWDIYVPRKRLLVTFLAQGESMKPLRVVKWRGPPGGPYKIARYKLVPNEILGKPPVQDISGLADLYNKEWTKIGRQISREKWVGYAQVAALADAEKIRNAQDGEIVPVTHKDALQEFKMGGPANETLAAAMATKQEISYQGGNLDTMGGLSTQADTLGQEQILQQSSSGRLRSRQQTFRDLIKACLIDVGWYIWNDPMVRVTVTDKLPGTSLEMEFNWPRETNEYGQQVDLRQGEYSDLNLDILPYSLHDKSPQEISQMLDQIVMQIILPAMPALQAQQLAFDWREYLEIKADLLGIPQLKDLIIDLSPQPQQTDPSQLVDNMGGTKPPQTTRQYDRVVKPQSPQAQTNEMISNMMGRGRQSANNGAA